MKNRLSHDQFKKLLEQAIKDCSPSQLEAALKKILSQYVHMGSYWEKLTSENHSRKFRLTIQMFGTLHYRDVSLPLTGDWAAEDVIRLAVEGNHIDSIAAALVHDVEEMHESAEKRVFMKNAGEILKKYE